MRYAAAALAAITSAVLAGCSTAAPPAVTAPPAAAASSAATPVKASSSPAPAPSGQSAPGPFKITSLSCGKLTAAQQNQFGTTAASGFVYKFTNNSASLTAAPKVSVNFLEGTTVLASNVTGSLTQVSPGQSGTGEVDALDASGNGLSFKGCQVMSYAVVTSSGVLPQQYAP